MNELERKTPLLLQVEMSKENNIIQTFSAIQNVCEFNMFTLIKVKYYELGQVGHDPG